jgi:hypothetical protein
MNDFNSVIQALQPREFTNVFGDNKGGNLVGQKTSPEQIADPIKVLYFSKVFVIWKPYYTCPLCEIAFNAGEVTHEEDSDYTCPHTNNREYEETINLCLSGKALLQKQDFVDLKNGTRIAHVMWLIVDPKYVEEQKKKKESAAKNKVYPPNPAKVFAEEEQKIDAGSAKEDLTDPAAILETFIKEGTRQ